jgi:exopolyphosphatase / guanosine-5'-triphosphate,3'-diphosphate pyrophosphatase
MLTTQRLGIIDLGSNTARLVIYHYDLNGLMLEKENVKSALKLADKLDKKGYLDDKTIRETVAVMTQFRALLESSGVSETYGVATAAVRQAINGQLLLDTIQQETGIKLRLLAGEEEAYYGALAVKHTIALENAIVVDMGGGSTEITLIENSLITQRHSLNWGVVNLNKQFNLNPKQFVKIQQLLKTELKQLDFLKDKSYPLVGLGGTFRTVAKIHQRVNQYPFTSLHHYGFREKDLLELLNQFIQYNSETIHQRLNIPKERLTLVPAAILMFQAIADHSNSSEVYTSNKGLRDGILYEKLQKGARWPKHSDLAIDGAEQLLRYFQVNYIHAKHIKYLALGLFDTLAPIYGFSDRHRRLLKIASLLQDLGRSISLIESYKHTFHLLTHLVLPALSHEDRIIVALLASFKSQKTYESYLAPYIKLLKPEDMTLLPQLGIICALARTLDRPMTQVVEALELSVTDKKKTQTYHLSLVMRPKEDLGSLFLEDVIERFEKIYKVKLTVGKTKETITL